MRPRHLFLALPLLLLLGLLVIGLRDHSRPPAPSAPLTPAPAPLPPSSPTPSASVPAALPPPPVPSDLPASPDAQAAGTPRRPTPLRIPVGTPIPELFPGQALRDNIQALANTYDPTRIPAIAAYLDHDEPTVREAARLGLLQLGDPAALPLLRNARADTQEEKDARQWVIDALTPPPPPPPPSPEDEAPLPFP